MPLVSSVDYPNKRIYLWPDSVGVLLDTMDVYREVRHLRNTNLSHMKFDRMIVWGGNIQKTATTYTQPYVQLLNGCHIIPYPADQILTLIRDTFSDDGRSGSWCFDRTSIAENIDIVVAVDKVEVREIVTWGWWGWLTVEQANQLANTVKKWGVILNVNKKISIPL